MLINPKEFEIEDQQGNNRLYLLGKIPYMDGGREVCTQFFTTATVPSMYQRNEEISQKLFKYVVVLTDDGTEIPLKTKQLINNHIPDFVTGLKVEEAMLEHNVGFSVIGKIQEYRQQWAGNFPALIIKILTQLRAVLQPQDKPHSTNYEQSTQQKM